MFQGVRPPPSEQHEPSDTQTVTAARRTQGNTRKSRSTTSAADRRRRPLRLVVVGIRSRCHSDIRSRPLRVHPMPALQTSHLGERQTHTVQEGHTRSQSGRALPAGACGRQSHRHPGKRRNLCSLQREHPPRGVACSESNTPSLRKARAAQERTGLRRQQCCPAAQDGLR